ncbi:STAS domain-containing protein [Geoalkalibacter sp.]|uniref:STAS domain-containing protein n=1 Tax=Geoalkalibacter sp. TaxID=3041440 RepID=UPI00272EE00E|nr:STAS domain-containing protein [Geoalkalibacter sp.]
MSQESRQEPLKIEGDWSISGIALQHQRLEEEFTLWTVRGEGATEFREPVFCLESVEDIDLSGWQVLACAFRGLRARGLSPRLVNIRADLRRNLDLLGYSRELPIAGEQACP